MTQLSKKFVSTCSKSLSWEFHLSYEQAPKWGIGKKIGEQSEPSMDRLTETSAPASWAQTLEENEDRLRSAAL